MNTKKLERLLLLEQSGELTPRQRRALARADGAEPARRELAALRAAVQMPEAEPSPWTVAKIDARLREERRPALVWLRKPALALAACLVLAAGILNFHGKQTSSTSAAVVAAAEADVWSDQFEGNLVELENLITAMSGDPLDIMEM